MDSTAVDPLTLLSTPHQPLRSAYGFLSLWAGLTPAILGSMPSSALYFGVYEQVKRRLGEAVMRQRRARGEEELLQAGGQLDLRARRVSPRG